MITALIAVLLALILFLLWFVFLKRRRLGTTGGFSCGGELSVDFTTEMPGTRPNPLEVDEFIFDLLAPGQPETTLDEMSGHTGLNCGNLLRVTIPAPVSSIKMVLIHQADPVTVVATEPGGSPVGAPLVTSGSAGVPDTVTLTGANIGIVQIRSPQKKTVLLCIGAE